MNDLDHILYEVEQQERNFADFEDLRFAEIFLTDKEAKGRSVALHVGHSRNKSKQQS